MKRINCPLLVIWLLSSMAALSQSKNPYKSIGRKSQTLTLSKGKYEEFFDQDSIQQVGTVLMNVRTMKVVSLLNDKDARERLENDKGSRFLSVDPITSSFPELSPYQYASDNPVMNVDLDGLEGMAGNMASPGKWHIPGDANDDGHLTKEELKEGGTIMTVTALLPIEVFVTKGWITRTLIASEVLGAFEHNRAKTPEGRAAQDHRRNEALADAFIAWGTGKIFGIGMNLTGEAGRLAASRFNFAKQFYKEAGFAEGAIVDHTRGIDLSEKVFATTLKKGTQLDQWAYKDPFTKEIKMGNYYSLPGEDPSKLGISLENRVKVSVTLTEDTKFLQSTAGDIKDWTGSGKTFTGGGTQLFQTNVKYEVLKTPTTATTH
jgi:hypothetical protein